MLACEHVKRTRKRRGVFALAQKKISDSHSFAEYLRLNSDIISLLQPVVCGRTRESGARIKKSYVDTYLLYILVYAKKREKFRQRERFIGLRKVKKM